MTSSWHTADQLPAHTADQLPAHTAGTLRRSHLAAQPQHAPSAGAARTPTTRSTPHTAA